MPNPNADYPNAIHTPIDTSADSNLPLGTTTPKHTEVHGKIEEEVVALQTKLGIGSSTPNSGLSGYNLTINSDGSTSWNIPTWTTFSISGSVFGGTYQGLRNNPVNGNYNMYFGGGTPYLVAGGIPPGGNAVANLGEVRLNIFGISAHGYSGTGFDMGPLVFFNNSRGPVSAPVAVADGDLMGAILAGGWDGTDYNLAFNGVRFVVDGAVSPGVMPIKVQLLTNNAVVSELFANGDITFYKVGGSTAMLHMDATNGYVGVGSIAGTLVNPLTTNLPITNDTLAEHMLATTVSTHKGQVIQGVVSQTASLSEWQTSAGAVLFSIAAAGHPTFGEGINIIAGTSTGTKIGTTTSQKFGFFNATPIVQPSGNALTALSNLGLVTSPTLTSTNVGLGNVDNTSDATKNSATATLTNKRNTPRVTTITSNANPTINTDNCDAVTITAQGVAIASMTTNLSGTPNNFDKLIIRIKDDGTARAITWGASFVAEGVALPTTTTLSKVLTVGFIYDSVKAAWGCVAAVTEA